MNKSKFLLFLKCFPGIGDSSIRKIINSNSLENVEFENQESILAWIKSHSNLFNKRLDVEKLTIKDIDDAKNKRIDVTNKLENINAYYITYYDSAYPTRFKEIEDFPPVLFYRGNISLMNNDKICSIIGTRVPTDGTIVLGKEITKQMATDDYVIVSGLAKGCDTIAHKACLENSGKTVAILGCGIDIVYPKINAELANEILRNGGLLLTEQLPGTNVASYSLVARDRLQTAASDVLIVLETSNNGGSMHASKATVKYSKQLIVVDPEEIVDGKTSGNKELITYFGGHSIKRAEDLQSIIN